MQISKEQIETVKRSNDIVSVIESKKIRLKKKGKNLVALCPFHKEKTPSFTVDPIKQLYNCFGCSSGGDVIGFIVKHDNISFREAVDLLSNGSLNNGRKKTEGRRLKAEENPKSEIQNPKSITPKSQKLLKRVADFYHTTFTESGGGLKYLVDERKITDKNIFRDFKIGFANGTLLNTLPDDGEIIESLKGLGILNKKGNEFFYGSVVFPIYDLNGHITSIYGRKIKDQENNHLYLPGPRKGLFNWQSAKLHKEIILTESIIDSLTLYNAGFKNTIPCYGTNGLTEDHLSLFKRYETKTVYLCFDADEPGMKAAQAITPKLTELNINVYPAALPEGQDVNDFFSLTANPISEFKKLMAKANPALAERLKETAEEKNNNYRKTGQGFTVKYADREYEIIGISRTETRLKATVKGIKTDKGQRRFHVDTVDLYSSRSRHLLIGGLIDLFGEGEGVITEDMNKIMELIEQQIKKGKLEDKEKPKEEITAKDKQAAMKLLKDPNLLDKIIHDIETLGYTGDNTTKLLCYIAAISRKMDDPLSVMIQSRSAAGKSFLQDTILSLMPEQGYVKYTRLTDQSLFYKEQDSLKHKILAIEEMDGMSGAAYSIRAMQSSQKISVAYTGKDPMTGDMKTGENTVEGPVMIFITTTAVDIDAETASRFFFPSLDESKEMTEKILEKQREKHTLEGLINKLKSKKVIKKHHALNSLLKPLWILNPYSKLLTFTSRSLRVRRDHMKYLNLILAIAFLHQYQREIKKMNYGGKETEYITVKISDIERANKIANEVLGMSLHELSAPSRRLFLLIKEMVLKGCKQKKTTPREYHFSRREIREYTGWSDFQIRTHIKELVDLEYIYAITGRKGTEYVYELIYTEDPKEKGERNLLGQIDIEELKKKAKKAGIPIE